MVDGDDKYLSIINSVNDYISSMMDVKIFDPSDENNAVSSMKKSLLNVCSALEEAGVSNPTKLTLREFNAKISYFENKNK